MPQITTVRVVRKRSVQPEQFGNATAEVELVGNVLEGEDPKQVARQMLVDSRALVYENLGLRLPASAVENAAEVDTPTETATAETEEPKKRPRGRPKGSTNTRPKKETAAAKRKREEAEAAADEVPGDEPNISTGEARVGPDDNPADHGVPGDDEVPGAEEPADAGMDAAGLNDYINGSIRAHKLSGAQAKQMMREMQIARIRDLDSPEKVTKAKVMIDSFIKANEAK